MGPEVIFYSLAILLVLVVLGVHIGVALGVASVIGVYLSYGSVEIALYILGSTAYDAIRTDALAVIPLFMLMGEIISRSGAARDLYLLCDRAMRRMPGRLAAATVLGNAAFAAVSGVAIASAATFSRIAYPEMRRLGYKRSYAVGVIAGSGSLGMLIPPSVLMIVWAILTEGSVGALFLGGVVPGLLLGSAFIAYCAIAAIRNPELAPPTDTRHERDRPAGEARSELVSGLGIIALIFVVLGGIWLGVFTPTEAAGFGALGSLVVGLAKGMRWHDFIEAIYNAGRSTAPIMFLLITGSMYSRLLAVSGGINLIQELFFGAGLGPFGIIVIMTIIWLALGTLIDSISDILLTIPIFVPIAIAAGFDPIAFAIYGILIIEAGLLTPPMGLLIFTVKASVPDPDVTLQEIFRGAIPYWIVMIGVAISILVFPGLAAWLPGTVLQ
ncbi:MAG: TRAP transporter large permease [Gammaproteobacteria bacterium]|nr:TRAP transporter large permease [Gammaproteobacteria bacterium]MDH3506498.1 TRAP transporter large permease [Gammaproteobacteria bacterium]